MIKKERICNKIKKYNSIKVAGYFLALTLTIAGIIFSTSDQGYTDLVDAVFCKYEMVSQFNLDEINDIQKNNNDKIGEYDYNKNYYINVIDLSLSFQKKNSGEKIKTEIKNEISDLNTKCQNFKKPKKIDGVFLSKLFLNKLICNTGIGKNAVYNVWSLNAEPELIFPTKDSIFSSRSNVSENLNVRINAIGKHKSLNKETNFKKLFERIFNNNKLQEIFFCEEQKDILISKPEKNIIITIFSDFIHSDPKKNGDPIPNDFIEKKELASMISNFSNYPIKLNLIKVKQYNEITKRFEFEVSEIIENNFSWQYLDSKTIGFGIEDFKIEKYINRVQVSKKNLKFFYSDKNNINATVKLFPNFKSRKTSVEIELTGSYNKDDYNFPKFELLAENNDPKNNSTISKSKLIPGIQKLQNNNMRPSEIFKLTFEGILPYNYDIYALSINANKHKHLSYKGINGKNYYIPISFVKVAPSGLKGMFTVIFYLFLCIIICIICKSIMC